MKTTIILIVVLFALAFGVVIPAIDRYHENHRKKVYAAWCLVNDRNDVPYDAWRTLYMAGQLPRGGAK